MAPIISMIVSVYYIRYNNIYGILMPCEGQEDERIVEASFNILFVDFNDARK